MNFLLQGPVGNIQASVQLPSSKSISNRALILNALSYSSCDIQNLSDCDDTQVMMSALSSNDSRFDIKAAGTAMRFLTAFLSKVLGEWTITGTERMRNRPIKPLVDALNSVGARIEYIEKEGFPPLRIYGSALQGGEVSLPGNISSQYISALLMIAPMMEKGLILRLEGTVISKPYINLTLQLMARFGIHAEWNGQVLRVDPQEYTSVPSFVVESDWSAASYWYAMAALSGTARIELLGLSENSLQGDAAGADLFLRLGVETTFTDKGVLLKNKGERCEKLVYDFTDQPDLAQTFVVVCALMNLPFCFTGLQSLKIKETDRIEALKRELRKLGYAITDSQNSILEWNGERCANEEIPLIHTYEDHRMAMAFSPASLVLDKGLWIADAEVVSKSYPRFWDDLRMAGFRVDR